MTDRRDNKNIYRQIREEMGLSREQASELLETIQPERIARIENETFEPKPDEVIIMADKYKHPELCNYYCAHQCPIGREYVPEVQMGNLSQIVLETVASLNAMNDKKDKLIEIAADGDISTDELDDFILIQEELERISLAVESLQLWSEKMKANGSIDMEEYRKRKEELNKKQQGK